MTVVLSVHNQPEHLLIALESRLALKHKPDAAARLRAYEQAKDKKLG